MKKTIMLVCAAGMSTSLMVERMKKASQAKGIESDIFAVSAGEADSCLENKKVDALLLGPQVRFMKAEFEKKVLPLGIKVDVIQMTDYGMMNGEKVLDQALKLISE